MTTFIKANLKKSDDHLNIAANITEYHIKINLPWKQQYIIHDDKAIISFM